MGAEIAPPPNVPHLAIAERAANRRRPCDQHGDGYRDTLNWLTLLALASRHPDEKIIWVSNNTQDFGDGPDATELHPELRAELAEVDADTRVRWVSDLKDLVLALAAAHAPGSSPELTEIHATVQRQSVLSSIATEVLNKAHGRPLDAQRCGLSRATSSARIIKVGEPDTPIISRRGPLPDQGTVIEFSVTAETTILVTVPPGITPQEITRPNPSPDNEAGDAVTIAKQLDYSGIMTLDAYDHFIDAELTDIKALAGDSGLQEWAPSRTPPTLPTASSPLAFPSLLGNPSQANLAALLTWLAIMWFQGKADSKAPGESGGKLWPQDRPNPAPTQPQHDPLPAQADHTRKQASQRPARPGGNDDPRTT